MTAVLAIQPVFEYIFDRIFSGKASIGLAMTLHDILPHGTPAHELYGDFWFNSDPVPMRALHGRVVLLDFWDYTCSSCLRTLPYVKEWHRKYAESGLVVVGVHTPKFPFGRNPENVQKAIARSGIEYPVVMDNEYLIWTNYGCRSWPTKILVDKNGFVRCQSIGEGDYLEFERVIQTLLYDAGVSRELPLMMEPLRESDRAGSALYRATPELFTGYLRGSIGNVEGYSAESVVEYTDPQIYIDGRFYVDGKWLNDRNCLRFVDDEKDEGHIILSFRALDVNVVIKLEGEKPGEVTVTQDEQFLTKDNKGDDVRVAPDGKSCLVIDEPRMYNVVRNKEFGEHVLRLTTTSKGLALYSFMFVSGVIPELVSNN